jgi:hypothetical protein
MKKSSKCGCMEGGGGERVGGDPQWRFLRAEAQTKEARNDMKVKLYVKHAE